MQLKPPVYTIAGSIYVWYYENRDSEVQTAILSQGNGSVQTDRKFRAMKKSIKKRIIWSGTTAAAAAGLISCQKNIPEAVYGPPEYFNPSNETTENVPECVYGPPEWFEEESAEAAGPVQMTEDPDETTASETDETTEGPAETTEEAKETTAAPYETSETAPEAETTEPDGFEPEENVPEDVYGPPSWFGEPDEDPTEEMEDETASIGESSFDPEDNVAVTVYGPPEWWEDNRTLGPDVVYKPEEDIAEPVYGPPEWLEINDGSVSGAGMGPVVPQEESTDTDSPWREYLNNHQ